MSALEQEPVEDLYVSEQAWKAIQGAYDLHVHVAPDIVQRRIDDLDLAKECLTHGLKGFVLKSHYFPTVERAKVVTKAVPGISVFGSITLNHTVGGLSPLVLDVAGRSGNRVVWMPTVDADNEKSARDPAPGRKLPFWAAIQRELVARGFAPDPITVLNADGSIKKEVRLCLEIIAEYDMVLATGHLSRHEIFALVAEAREVGVKRMVVTHALFPAEDLTVSEQVQLSQMGAYIEHCYTTFHTGKASWQSLFESIRAVGPERCVLSTDLGQANPMVSGHKLLPRAQVFNDSTVLNNSPCWLTSAFSAGVSPSYWMMGSCRTRSRSMDSTSHPLLWIHAPEHLTDPRGVPGTPSHHRLWG